MIQIRWALDLTAAWLGCEPPVAAFDGVSFRTPLRPGDRFRLRLHLLADGWVGFRIYGDGGEHASGRISLEPNRELDA